MTSNRRTVAAFALPSLVASLLLTLTACQGPQGPPGQGVEDLDTQPPLVSLRTPSGSDTVYTDTLTLAANASDNLGVVYVEFFVDGSSELGSRTALDSTAPYGFLWDRVEAEKGYGSFPVIARAFDEAGNHGDSAPILLTLLPRPAQITLSYFGEGSESHLTMPNPFGDRYYNVRFSPPDSCRVLELHFAFRDPDGAFFPRFSGQDTADSVLGGAGTTAFLWTSQADAPFPDWAQRDSVELAETDLVYGDWTVVDFRASPLGPFGGDFHGGINAPAGQYDLLMDQQFAAPLMVNVAPDTLVNEANHRSMQYVPEGADQGWGTMQRLWGEKIDLQIRALVEFTGSGEVVLLSPGAEDGRGQR